MQLLPVQTPVKVPTSSHRRGQQPTPSIDSLPDANTIAATSDFADQDRSQAFRTQLLVHAHEVDLGAADGVGADAERDGDAGDEGDEFAGGGCADAYVPVCAPAGGLEGPGGMLVGV